MILDEMPGTVSSAEVVVAESAAKSEGSELSGRPAFVAAGITFEGMVLSRRLERIVV